MLSRLLLCIGLLLNIFGGKPSLAEALRPDLAVEVIRPVEEPVAGQPYSLTIRVANRGTAPALNVVLTNTLDFDTLVISWPNGRFDRNLLWDRIEPAEVKEFRAEIIPFPPLIELQCNAAFQEGETVLFNNSFSLSEVVLPGATIAPVIRIVPPDPLPQGLRLGQFATLSALVTDEDGELRRVRIYFNDSLVKEFRSAPFTVSTRLTASGIVPVRVVADDNLGGRTIATLNLEIRPPEIGELFITESSIHRVVLAAGAEPNRECHLFTSTDLATWELFQKVTATDPTVTFNLPAPLEALRFYKVFHPKPPEGGGH